MSEWTETWARSGKPTALERAIWECGMQAGRKQVVEFTRMLITQLDSHHGFIKRLEASPDWQAKLKGWGVNP